MSVSLMDMFLNRCNFFWTMFSSCALPFNRNEALCNRVVMGLKHSASDSSTISSIVIHSIYLKNQLKLSAIVTNQFFIVNTNNVYNNAVWLIKSRYVLIIIKTYKQHGNALYSRHQIRAIVIIILYRVHHR